MKSILNIGTQLNTTTTSQTTSSTTAKPTTTSASQTTTTTTASQITTSTTAKPTTTSAPQSTTSTSASQTTTSASSESLVCNKGDGYYAMPGCKQFYQCVFSGTANEIKSLQSCQTGLLFDVTLNVCNWSNRVSCNV